jgi:predicted permease
MDNLIISINVILPILILLSCGYLLKRTKMLNEDVNRVMNRIVALVLLPILVFDNIYNSSSSDLFNGKVLIFVAAGIMTEFIVSFFLVRIFTGDQKKRGAMLQGMFRSNYVIFGIPIAISLFGNDGSAAAAILTTTVIPMYNILAVIALDSYGPDKPDFKKLMFRIVTNPLIIGSLLGLLFKLTGVVIPTVILKPLDELAACATPMAFIFLGASFSLSSTKMHFKELLTTILFRLVIFPLVIISTAVLMGIRGVWLVCIMVVFASPTAVSSYSLAQTLGSDDKLAGNIVIYSTALSIITMFFFVLILKSFAFI